MKTYTSPIIKMTVLEKNDIVTTSGYYENELPMVPFTAVEDQTEFQ